MTLSPALAHLSAQLDIPRTPSPASGLISRDEPGYQKVQSHFLGPHRTLLTLPEPTLDEQVSFEGKAAHLQAVVQLVQANGFIPEPLVQGEVNWFYSSLGIDDGYFAVEDPETCADHIEVSRPLSLSPPRSLRRNVLKAPQLTCSAPALCTVPLRC